MSEFWRTLREEALKSELVTKTQLPRGIWVVTLNAPAEHNIFSPLMMSSLAITMDTIGGLPEAEVSSVILTANGSHFCAGVDINAIRDAPMLLPSMGRKEDPWRAVSQCKVPVIACVRGAAFTGGFELAMACDIRLASKDALFKDNHVYYGCHPNRGLSQLLQRTVGTSNAKLASLASIPVPGSLALQWGLVSQLVERPDDLLPAALIIAQSIANNTPQLVRYLKVTMNEGYDQDLHRAKDFELERDLSYYSDYLGEQLSHSVLTEGARRYNEVIRNLERTG